MTKLEEIARAMCEDDGAKWDAADCLETSNGDDPEDQRAYWLGKALAAVRALREPTEGMKVNGGLLFEAIAYEDDPRGTGVIFNDIGIVYQGMVDAILSEAKQETAG